MDPFRTRAAVVTGASSGIGRALARELHRRGAAVYAASRSLTALEALRDECGGERLHPVALDVVDEVAVGALFDRVAAEQGALDYVFNNAGIVVGGDFESMDFERWRRIVDVNLWGVVHGTQHAYARMVRQGRGHIVNVASTAGVVPVAKSTAYTATKHAVVGLSTALREEGRRRGVRVSVVLPGLVDTAIFERAINLERYDYAASIDRVPLRKISPEQAARATLEGVERNRPFIVYPGYNRAVIGLYRLFPRLMGRLVNWDVA
jgi:short-subunit dehydrogenase